MSGIDVPANTTVELKPAGDHVMLDGLKQPLLENQMFTLMVMLSTGDEFMIPVHVQDDAPSETMEPMTDMQGN
jgi:copper(I)-binding protein